MLKIRQEAMFSHFSQNLLLVIYPVDFLWRNTMVSPLFNWFFLFAFSALMVKLNHTRVYPFKIMENKKLLTGNHLPIRRIWKKVVDNTTTYLFCFQYQTKTLLVINVVPYPVKQNERFVLYAKNWTKVNNEP